MRQRQHEDKGEATMTQIVTVSAYTAAYATEAAKPAIRAPRKQVVEDAVRDFETTRNGGVEESSTADTIKAVAAELSMMNFNDHHPQASIQQALDAYHEIEEDDT